MYTVPNIQPITSVLFYFIFSHATRATPHRHELSTGRVKALEKELAYFKVRGRCELKFFRLTHGLTLKAAGLKIHDLTA